MKEFKRRKNGWAGIVRYGGIGDNLIAVSPAHALKRAGYKVEVISADPAHVVFYNNPHIDKLAIKSKVEIPDKDMLGWQTWHRGRSDEYDLFAHLSHSVEHLFAYVPASTYFYYPAEMRRRMADKSYIEHAHDLFGMPYEFAPLFYPDETELKDALEVKERVGGPVIGWCLSGTRIDKIHPYSPMAIGRLIRELNVSVILLGGGEKNFKSAEAIQDHVGRQNGSLEGLHLAMGAVEGKDSWPIRRGLSLATQCDLVIGPDTGTMWAVAFEQLPKIMLLSHASPTNITKHWRNTVTLHADRARVPCWPCHQLHDSPDTCTPNKEGNGAACITDISVDRILAEADRALNRSGQLLLAAE